MNKVKNYISCGKKLPFYEYIFILDHEIRELLFENRITGNTARFIANEWFSYEINKCDLLKTLEFGFDYKTKRVMNI